MNCKIKPSVTGILCCDPQPNRRTRCEAVPATIPEPVPQKESLLGKVCGFFRKVRNGIKEHANEIVTAVKAIGALFIGAAKLLNAISRFKESSKKNRKASRARAYA